MEYQASVLEDDENKDEILKGDIQKFLQDPDPKIVYPSAIKEMHVASMNALRGLKDLDQAREFYGKDIKFMDEHGSKYFPLVGQNLVAFTLEFGPAFRQQHPNEDIFELLFFAEQMLRMNQKDANTRIQEFIQKEKLPPIETMNWGTDAPLIQAQRQELLNSLKKFRGLPADPVDQQADPVDQQADPVDQQVQPDAHNRATLYDAAARRNYRKPYVGKAIDPSCDKCTIIDPETKQQVQAEIIGRHPHRRKWLVCAIHSLNKDYPKLQRFVTIDGTSGQYRDILEKYDQQGSNEQLLVGSKGDLNECRIEDFELNGVVLLPWGDSIRMAAYGLSHSKKQGFRLFPKTVLCSKWGVTTGVAIMHCHLQKCGSRIPECKTGKEVAKPETWYP
ncbi:hypothetical protein FBEOM_12806 [Fusarium beomiforme]|uniref:Uncharacterized protein n=1 Tax=Fusarium beomiforme TaxID=44412 RepID=A0A9P5A727_9HYPO|nr:hypothetical protein FBEOM_12806 [Fusarium beomiforme]